MKVLSTVLVFCAIMLFVMATAGTAHFFVLANVEPMLQKLLFGFYLMNTALGMLIGATIIYLSNVRPEITGFAFMGGSLLKFGVFFLLFYNDLSPDEAERKTQFIQFFIPYALSMIIEVWYLIRFLNKQA